MGILDIFRSQVGRLQAKKDVAGLLDLVRRTERGKYDPDKVMKALVSIGEIEPLLETLDNESDWDVLEVAVSTLAVITKKGDTEATEPLIRVIRAAQQHFDYWAKHTVCNRALEALGNIGDERAVEILVEALNKKTWWLMSSAAEALGKIGDPRAVLPLIETIKMGESHSEPKAVEALARIGKQAVEALSQRLKNEPDSDIRAKVVKALGVIQDESVVDILVGTLGDKSDGVRFDAAEALAQRGDRRAIEPLREVLGNLGHGENVRRRAAELLSAFDSKLASDLINKKVEVPVNFRKQRVIPMSDYGAFLQELASALKTTNTAILHARHQGYCARCGFRFSSEALSHLHLFGPGTNFHQTVIIGRTGSGDAIRAGVCPKCGDSNLRIVVE